MGVNSGVACHDPHPGLSAGHGPILDLSVHLFAAPMTPQKRISLAMVEARRMIEYGRRGDVVMARQVQRTIDDLVGQYVDGRFCLPVKVLREIDRLRKA